MTVKRIFRYLKETPNLGLWYPMGTGFEAVGYTNEDFVGCRAAQIQHPCTSYQIKPTTEKKNEGKTNSAEKGKGKKGTSHSSEKKENKRKLLWVLGQISTCLDVEVEKKVKQIQAEVGEKWLLVLLF
ncbi:hypothetical protein AgCh_011962 [Apium graveolens]